MRATLTLTVDYDASTLDADAEREIVEALNYIADHAAGRGWVIPENKPYVVDGFDRYVTIVK